jgi:hypothetical protein
MTLEENTGAVPPMAEPDAHGQAALLFAESILHMLVERSILSVEDAVSVVQTATEVKLELATEAGESRERMQASLDLLFRISDSFAADISRRDGSGRNKN